MGFNFLSGFVQSHEFARVIAQDDELLAADVNHSLIMKWNEADQEWSYFDLDWIATRLWVMFEPNIQLFATGPAGIVSVVTAQDDNEEMIDDSPEGPCGHGDIRDLRLIGEHLYVTGMGRQVYRRDGLNKWSRQDMGLVQPLGTLEVSGLNAIDGLNESDIYAVGFGGEIWRYKENKWCQNDSPTNLVLHCVRVIRSDLVYASGQAGILLRGYGNIWESIEHDATDEDLWGMEWFNGKLYVTCDDGLFVLTDSDKLKKADMGLGDSWTCRHLHANDGVMWSFGPKHLAWTEDGKKWIDVTP